MRKINLLLLSFIIIFISFSNVFSAQKKLGISPVYQRTPVWCWVSCGEMVFKYYKVPNLNPGGDYQCGIIASYFGQYSSCWTNCYTCQVGSGTAEAIQDMIARYLTWAKYYYPNGNFPMLSSMHDNNYLSFEEVKSQIKDGHPMIAGVNPSGYKPSSGSSEHAVVIIGYNDTQDENYLYINDPFPYNEFFNGNPYTRNGGTKVKSGQYKISYDSFVDYLAWNNTIYDIY